MQTPNFCSSLFARPERTPNALKIDHAALCANVERVALISVGRAVNSSSADARVGRKRPRCSALHDQNRDRLCSSAAPYTDRGGGRWCCWGPNVASNPTMGVECSTHVGYRKRNSTFLKGHTLAPPLFLGGPACCCWCWCWCCCCNKPECNGAFVLRSCAAGSAANLCPHCAVIADGDKRTYYLVPSEVEPLQARHELARRATQSWPRTSSARSLLPWCNSS